MREILIVSGNVPKPHAGANQEWLVFRNQGAHRIATMMRALGRDAEVVDNAQWFTPGQAKELLASRLGPGSKLLAFSVAFWFGSKGIAAQWAREARALAPGIKVAVCGPKMSSAMDFLPGADYVVSGYAEGAVPDLLAHLEGRGGLRASRLPCGALAVRCQVDYPQPALPDLVTRMETRDFVEPGETLFLEASRGCVFKCAFCDFHLIGKRKGDYIRPREAMLEQIAEHSRWGVRSFILSDETSNEIDSKLEDLAWARRASGVDARLSGFVRADLLAARPHQLGLMEDAGLMSWHCGLESFNEESAKAVGKGAMAGRKVAQFLESAKAAYGDALSVSASVIVGLPFDTADDVRESARWVAESEVVSHCTWFRLWLFDKMADPLGLLATDGLSMLAGDPARYGYSRLEAPGVPGDYAGRVEPAEFLWRSKAGMDIFQAADLADELNLSSLRGQRKWRDYSMWGRAAASGLGLPALGRPDLPVDMVRVEMLHGRRAARYVRRKLQWSDMAPAEPMGGGVDAPGRKVSQL